MFEIIGVWPRLLETLENDIDFEWSYMIGRLYQVIWNKPIGYKLTPLASSLYEPDIVETRRGGGIFCQLCTFLIPMRIYEGVTPLIIPSHVFRSSRLH